MTRNFLFDLDGTLVDSLPGIATAVSVALSISQPPAEPANARALIGPPVRTILKTLAGPCAETELDWMEAQFRWTYDSSAWRQTQTFPGIPELLKQLRDARKQMFVVTNKPQAPAVKILRMLNLEGFFTDVVSPDAQTPGFENKTDMLRSVLARWQLNPRESVYVGDTIGDYRASRSVGMECVLLAHGYGADAIGDEVPPHSVLSRADLISEMFLTEEAVI